jgi:tetratricopeptide (TPR) repeat protein
MERILLDESELVISELLSRIPRSELWNIVQRKKDEKTGILKRLLAEDTLDGKPRRPAYLDSVSVAQLKSSIAELKYENRRLKQEQEREHMQYGQRCPGPPRKTVDAQICYLENRITEETLFNRRLKSRLDSELDDFYESLWKQRMMEVRLLSCHLLRSATDRQREEMARRRETMARNYCKGAEGYYPLDPYSPHQFYQLALYHFEDLIEFFPAYTRIDGVFYLAGRVAHILGFPREGVPYLNEVIERGQDGEYYFEAAAERLKIRVLTGDYRRAVAEALDYAIGDFPHELRNAVRYHLGTARCRTGDHTNGIALLKAIPSTDTLYGDSRMEMARTYLTLDENDNAVEYLEKIADEERTRFPDAWDRANLLLGYIFHDEGSTVRSRNQFYEIPQYSSLRGKAIIGTAWTLIEEERLDDACAVLEELTRTGEDLDAYEALYTLGEIHLSRGDFEEAEYHFNMIRDRYNQVDDRRRIELTAELESMLNLERRRLASLKAELNRLKEQVHSDATMHCALLPLLKLQAILVEQECEHLQSRYENELKLSREQEKLAWMRKAEYKIMDVSFVKRKAYDRSLIDLLDDTTKSESNQ